ncbi:MAG: hypothetical protein ACT4PV_09290 [Planctomycetaceae bacterium]
MSRWTLPALLAAAGIALGIFVASRPPEFGPGTTPQTEARGAQGVRGTVLAAGGPVVGARVELFEITPLGVFAGGAVATGPDGAFTLDWTPQASDRRKDLFLRVSADGFPALMLPAETDPVEVRLEPAVEVIGRALLSDGTPVAGAKVTVAQRHQPDAARAGMTDGEGRFAAGWFPRGAPLQITVRAERFTSPVDGRFRAGDPVTLRLLPARALDLFVRTPSGSPVIGARAAIPAPFALRDTVPQARTDGSGRARLEGVSAGSHALLVVAADGYIPVDVLAEPHLITEVVLWPLREVEVTAYDLFTRKGVAVDDFQISPALGDGEHRAWWGEHADLVIPRYPRRALPAEGRYLIGLPACACAITGEAAAYVESEFRVRAGATLAGAPFRPEARGRPAFLLLRRAAAPGQSRESLPLALVDEAGGWQTVLELTENEVEVAVPPERRLLAASPCAAGGVWAPRQELETPPAGEQARREIVLRPAIAVRMRVDAGNGGGDPPGGEVVLHDPGAAGFDRPRRAPLSGGVASLWARPQRSLRLEVLFAGNYFAETRQLEPSARAIDLKIVPRVAAGLEVRVVDASGAPVSFAKVSLFPPGAGGVPDLWATPLILRAEAAGRARFAGLAGGEGALEVAAEGFRGQRFSLVTLTEGGSTPFPEVRLLPAEVRRGRVVDLSGAALAGVRLRVLSPRMGRLTVPGRGELDLYDPADGGIEVATAQDGSFELLDESPAAPVWWVHPQGGADLPPAAFLPPDVGGTITVPPLARVGLHLPGSVMGVFLLLPGGKAVLLQRDASMSIRPLPVVVPAQPLRLYIRLRNGRSATLDLDLKPGESRELEPVFR